jgi:hypothetical protein
MVGGIVVAIKFVLLVGTLFSNGRVVLEISLRLNNCQQALLQDPLRSQCNQEQCQSKAPETTE